MDMDNLALKRVALNLGRRFDALAQAVKPAQDTATPAKEKRADGVITDQERLNLFFIKEIIVDKCAKALSRYPGDAVSKLYAYSTAVQDVEKLNGGGARVARLNLDRVVPGEQLETLADRYIVRAFEKEARANARSHLQAMKLSLQRQPG